MYCVSLSIFGCLGVVFFFVLIDLIIIFFVLMFVVFTFLRCSFWCMNKKKRKKINCFLVLVIPTGETSTVEPHAVITGGRYTQVVPTTSGPHR